jgi:hypothetical protein
MNFKNKKIILIISVVLTSTIAFFVFSKADLTEEDKEVVSSVEPVSVEKIENPPTNSTNPVDTPILKTAANTFLEINGQEIGAQIEDTTSVYDFMSQLRDEGKMNFKDKNYVGMGKFIYSINGTDNAGTKNWIYYVNGKKALIGVSSHIIKPGDVVSWKFEGLIY